MLRDYLNENLAKIPSLVYHSMNLCDNFIVVYGGKSSINEFSGDLYILKTSKNKFVCANYSDNIKCKKYLYV